MISWKKIDFLIFSLFFLWCQRVIFFFNFTKFENFFWKMALIGPSTNFPMGIWHSSSEKINPISWEISLDLPKMRSNPCHFSLFPKFWTGHPFTVSPGVSPEKRLGHGKNHSMFTVFDWKLWQTILFLD